jgi:3-oxoacyl-[acyl-carrier-protein] synthase II
VRPPTSELIGITGVGIICASGRNTDEFWHNVLCGRAGIGPLQAPEFAEFEDPYGGEIPDEWLEACFDDVARAEHDRATLLAIEAARQALAHAGHPPANLGPAYGIVVGKCQVTTGRAQSEFGPIHALTDHLACHLGLQGPNLVVSTACAAGSNAVGIARDKLLNGEADVVLAGGVDVLNVATYAGFRAMQALSSRPCAPYSRSDGLNLGEGAAFLVVERIADAQAAGREVLAEVRGYGLSADAYHATAPDPTGRGPGRAVLRALDDAGATVDEVTYVNGHGTGTPTNDRMERKAMRLLFGERVRDLPISGTKSFVGHTLGASGAIEAVACVLAIRDGIVPPTVNFVGTDPDFDFVPNHSRTHDVDLVVSTNYAFGGNNACLVLSRPNSRPNSRPEPHLAPERRADAAADRSEASGRVVITGLGPAGPLGLGLDAWQGAFADGRSAIGRITEFDTGDAGCDFGAAMAPVPKAGFADPRLWRHLNELTRLCVVATRLACADAALPMDREARDRMGLVFATGFGPVNDALGFIGGPGGTSDVRVSTFANITFNAPAGGVCLALGLRGPTTTLSTGATSAAHAIACGADLIRLGKASTVIVLAAEELGPGLLGKRQAVERSFGESLTVGGLVRPYDCGRDGPAMGQAAVALVLEDLETARARSAPLYGEIRSWAARGDSFDPVRLDPSGTPFAATLRQALDRGAVSPADVGYCAGFASGHTLDQIEARALAKVLAPGTMTSAPRALTGDCEAASGAIGVLCCALAVSGRVVPPMVGLQHPIDDFTLTPLPIGTKLIECDHAIAPMFTWGGNYAAVVVSGVGT